MATKDTAATSAGARTAYTFKATDTSPKYELQLVAANYDGDIITVLGMTKAGDNGAADALNLTLKDALMSSLVIPLKVSGKKNNKKASAVIYVPRHRIEEAMNPTGGLVGKTFGALKISKVTPILRRRVSAI